MVASSLSFTSTVFGGGGREEVAAPDVYGQTVTADETVSTFKTGTDSKVTSVANMFKNSGFSLANVTALVSVKDGVSLNKDVLTQRMESATGYRFDSTNQYEADTKAAALAEFGKNTGLNNTGLIDADGNVSQVLTGDQVAARGVFGLVAGLTGNTEWLSKYPDLQAQAAVIGTVVAACLAIGLPDAIDDLLSKVDNEKERKKILINSLESRAKAGDLASLYKIKDYIGGREMYARCPKLVVYVLQGYSLPTSGTIPKYVDVYNKMVGLFDAVQPGWDYDTRAGERIFRLEPFTTASESSKKIFQTAGSTATKTGVDHRAMALIAPTYPSTLLKTLAVADFPKAGIK